MYVCMTEILYGTKGDYGGENEIRGMGKYAQHIVYTYMKISKII